MPARACSALVAGIILATAADVHSFESSMGFTGVGSPLGALHSSGSPLFAARPPANRKGSLVAGECLTGRCKASRSSLLMTATEAEVEPKAEKSSTEEERRLLGSRRLAGAAKAMKDGAHDKEGKLLGSKRAARAADIILTTPKDKNRLLGSQRLRAARDVLFSGVTREEDKKMFGSRRLASAHTILMDGAPVRASASAPPVSASASAPAIDSTEAPAAAVEVSEEAPAVAERKGPLQFGGIIATEAQKQQIEDIRSEIAKIPSEERSKMTKWVDELLDEDILRYVIQFKKDALNRIKATAVFRKEEDIDNILETDAEKFESYFEPGKEEIVYLAPDKLGRPILLYRSAFHWPGVQDPKEYTRYILYQTEKTRIRNGLGVDRQSCVIVERIGSGHKNQDPALLKVLLPTVLNHYPMYIGDVYIAPISTVFFIVWKLIQLILDEATKKRFHLLKGDYTAALREVINDDSIPDTLGGTLDVGDFCAKQRALDKAEISLTELEEQMLETKGDEGALRFGGKTAGPDELVAVGDIRLRIAELTPEETAKTGPWLAQIDNVDIFRFLTVHKTADKTWDALRETSEWRKENKIDTILDEDIVSGMFDEGMQEVFVCPPDKSGCPVVVYRSALHTPGRVDPKEFTRFVCQVVEKGTRDYGIGKTCQGSFIVDRIGSGAKNQDVPLLRELLPTLQRHYPQTISKIYIAPINTVFFLIWSVAQLLFDEDTRERVRLIKGDIKAELLKDFQAEVLPKNLGGDALYPDAGVV